MSTFLFACNLLSVDIGCFLLGNKPVGSSLDTGKIVSEILQYLGALSMDLWAMRRKKNQRMSI